MITGKTRIFLDSGDPEKTREVIAMGIPLSGQTTNPSLVAENPEVKARIAKGKKFLKEEILHIYKENIILPISKMIPDGSVSVEVYANKNSKAQDMYAQAKDMFSWIPNAHIKLPSNWEGIQAAGWCIDAGIRINMTLCFRQEQAAAVYFKVTEALRGEVFISPFVGRLDDRGVNGMDLIKNIMRMFSGRHHLVDVLVASVRTIDHMMYAFFLGADIITAPFRVLKEWSDKGMPLPLNDYEYSKGDLAAIPYKKNLLGKAPYEYDIRHELTDTGIERFANDWDMLIQT